VIPFDPKELYKLDYVWLMPWWRPYAELIVDGLKTVDVRRRSYTWLPGAFVLVYATRTEMKLPSRFAGRVDVDCSRQRMFDDEQLVVGVVQFEGSRPFVRGVDNDKAFYDPPLGDPRPYFSWDVRMARRFLSPKPLEWFQVKSPPQGPVRVMAAPLSVGSLLGGIL
jgi:hypothetical protein